MTSHVDAETLALSAEGLLEDTEESTVQQHMAECTACAAQQAQLADVTQALADFSAPPLPDSIAARLDDAVRAEVETRRSDSGSGGPDPSDHSSTSGAAPGPPANVVPIRRRFGSSNRWINYLALAAAAVVVVGGGSAVVRNLTSGETGGAPPHLAGPDSDSAGSAAQSDTALGYQPLVIESGTVYTRGQLDQQAAAVLDEADPMAPEGAQGNADGPGKAERPDPSEVPSDVSSCVQELAGESGDRPMLIDFAEFSTADTAGKAWVMYYGARPGSEAQESYDVVVVSPDCVEGGKAQDAVLARATVPAP
ncbi:hypothetical protein GCM10027570_18100 [Streptomonospora sediminis]